MPYSVVPLQLAFGTQLSYECDVRSLEQQKDPGLIQSRVVPGLNSVKMSIAVNQIVTNGAELEVFLGVHKGRFSFKFDEDAPPEILGKLFRCKDYVITYQGQTNAIEEHQVQATFVQSFRAGL